jgi:endoglucanase
MQMKILIVYIALIVVFASNSVAAQSPDEHIRLNQLGFYPAAKKIAVVVNDTTINNFYVIDVHKKDTVFKGKLSVVHHSNNSSLVTRIADFTSFNKQGEYIVVCGQHSSYPFNIQKNALHEVAVASLKGFYYQRMSMPLQEKYAGNGHVKKVTLILLFMCIVLPQQCKNLKELL